MDGESWQERAGESNCVCAQPPSTLTLIDETTPQYGLVELAERISSVTRDKRIMNSCSQSSGEHPLLPPEKPGWMQLQGYRGQPIKVQEESIFGANILQFYIFGANIYKLINKIKYF